VVDSEPLCENGIGLVDDGPAGRGRFAANDDESIAKSELGNDTGADDAWYI
jgi:hypothetical protein